jgi:hypothetical protein
MIAIPFDAWTEEDGNVLWWVFPIREAPYVGTPLDSDWPFPEDIAKGTLGWTRFEVPERMVGQWQ